MSPDIVERPSTAPPVIPLLPQAHLLNHDSEERAEPINHMASLLSGRYQPISSSERPRSGHELGSTYSDQQRFDEGLDTAQHGKTRLPYDSNLLTRLLDVPGDPNNVEWRRFLNSLSRNLFSTPASNDSKYNKQDGKSYEHRKDDTLTIVLLTVSFDII